MPFRVAGLLRNIFFGFSAVKEGYGGWPAWCGFPGIKRAEKWQSFSVTLRKVSLVTREQFTLRLIKKLVQRWNKSPIACFMTSPPTSEIDRVSGMSFGQDSRQFCA